MYKLLFIITICCSVYSLDAQFLKAQKDMTEIRLNKNHLELDIKNIFTGLSGASLIYKRRLESAKYVKVNSLNLLRITATIRYEVEVSSKDIPVPLTIDDYVPDAYYSGPYASSNRIGIGLEWQKMNKGFVHYFGSDLVFDYNKDFDSYLRTTYSSGTLYRQTRQESENVYYGLGLNPFFGIKYYFNSRLNLGIETGLYLGYQMYHTETKTVVHEYSGAELTTSESSLPDQKSGKILTSFNNLRFLTVGYCF